jgi:Tfp pilus assembly protein PilV
MFSKFCGPGEWAAYYRGFTLIEILVAIFTLTVVLLGLAPMAFNVLHYNNFTKNRTIAITLARAKIAELKRTALTAVLSDSNDGTESSLDENGVSGSGKFTRVVDVTGGVNLLTTLEVTVTWTDFAAQSISQTTFISQ